VLSWHLCTGSFLDLFFSYLLNILIRGSPTCSRKKSKDQKRRNTPHNTKQRRRKQERKEKKQNYKYRVLSQLKVCVNFFPEKRRTAPHYIIAEGKGQRIPDTRHSLRRPETSIHKTIHREKTKNSNPLKVCP
jgi:hypothetical protein